MKNKFEEKYFKIGRVVKVANGTYYLITKIEYGPSFRYINLNNGLFEQIPDYNKDGLSRDITSVGLDIDKIYESWTCEHAVFTNDQRLIADHMQDAASYEEKCRQREALRASLDKLKDETNDLYYKLMKED